jgi:hypothetical protein
MVEIALRFREFAGTYMEHCHNTQHEDHAMLLRWDIEHPGQVKLMPTPLPSWDGVSYVDSQALPTFRTGEGTGEYGPELDPINIWVDGMVVGELDDIRDIPIGDALDLSPNERGTATFPIKLGKNIDADGVETDVWYFVHDVSDEDLAEEMGVAWAGRLTNTPVAATSEASVTPGGDWTFFGDLPNPIHAIDTNHPGTPDVDDDNTYTPLRRVNIGGKDVVANVIIIQWGDEPWEHNRIDKSCVSFPDDPPNTTCFYNGQFWGALDASGHVLELDTTSANPHVTFKLHKSWSGEGDYLPYYIVLDTFPFPPSRAMGVPYVPKHKFLADAAVPLIQFLPGHPIDPSYPPTPSDENGLFGGGPFGSQVGVPSYFMPEDDYSPMWHIGFAHWLEPADKVLKGLEEIKEMRAQGKIEVLEWPPPPNVGKDNYDFENLLSPHVVNCPTPMTMDAAIHEARQLDKP